jgi:hypothetical protein
MLTKSITCNNGTTRYGFSSLELKKLFPLKAFSNLTFSVITARKVRVYNEILQRLYELFLFNPLNAELNPICHLLALLGGATIVDVSG